MKIFPLTVPRGAHELLHGLPAHAVAQKAEERRVRSFFHGHLLRRLPVLGEHLEVHARVGRQEGLQRGAVAVEGDLMQDPIVSAWRQAVEVLEGQVRLTLEQTCKLVERAVLCRLRRAQAERQIACAMLPVGMLPTATDTLA